MSSPGCPTLVLDLRSRRFDRRLVLTLAAIASCAPALLVHLCGVAVALGAALLIFGTCVLALIRAGWVGPRSLIRAAWQPEGHWILTEPSGRSVTAALQPSARMSPFAVWLRWTVVEEETTPACGASPVVLLTRWDLPAHDFRRLLVRLRIDRSQWHPLATSLSHS